MTRDSDRYTFVESRGFVMCEDCGALLAPGFDREFHNRLHDLVDHAEPNLRYEPYPDN